MSEQEVTMKDGHSLQALEEASAWLALMHGPRRTRYLENGFRRWIEASPQHEAAFDAVTATWDATSGLPKRPIPGSERRGALLGRRRIQVRQVLLPVLCAGLAAVVIAVYIMRHGVVATRIGEQRALLLDDGTRVYLNTRTRIRIEYSNERRGVQLDSGEALFDVAKQGPQRPFVVTAGGREVTALGTSFVVRKDASSLAVTLLNGRVAVSSAEPTSEDSRVLNPGQRLTFSSRGAATLDRPPVEQVVAWRQGRVEFDDTPLSAAIVEMNRYTTDKLRVVGVAIASIPVKGAFRAGDNSSFAQSIAITCHLRVEKGLHEILLTGMPSANCSR